MKQLISQSIQREAALLYHTQSNLSQRLTVMSHETRNSDSQINKSKSLQTTYYTGSINTDHAARALTILSFALLRLWPHDKYLQ